MKSRTIIYFFELALKSLKRNFIATIVSIITISIVLLVLGIFSLYILLVNRLGTENREIFALLKYSKIIAAIILPISSLFLVFVQVKMVLVSRKREIETMKLIGAHDMFIKFPFIIEGIIIGAIGAALARLSLSCINKFIYAKFYGFNLTMVLSDPILVGKNYILSFLITGIILETLGYFLGLRKVV